MQRPLHDIRHLLDNLAREGKALIVSAPTDATTGTATNFTVPVGQCAVITKLWCQGHGTADASPTTESVIRNSLSFVDAGGGAEGSFTFQAGQRLSRVWSGGSPNWMTAVPPRPILWEPSHPIVVPSGWSVDSDQTSQTCGGFGLYGYLLDNGLARRYGIDTNDDANPSKRLLKQGGANISSTGASLVAGKTDYCIQILDLYIRMQPLDHVVSTAKTIRFFQDQASDADFSPVDLDRTIFRFTNNNPELMEVKLSPGIYLKPGAGFSVIGSATADTLCSTVSYICRYVHKSQVPQTHFWGYSSPDLPTPAAGTTGTGSFIVPRSTAVTLYYPNPGVDGSGNPVTDTIANAEKQHVVEGIAWSLQKDLEVRTMDHVVFSVTAGASAGTLGVDVYGVTQTNKLLMPMLNAAGGDQNVSGCIDRVRIPCPKETGIFVESFALGSDLASTPSDGAANIDEWDVTVWGETIPAVYGTAHFKGSVS